MKEPGAGTVVLPLSGRVAAGGDIIGHLPDGRVVFVEDALPGETVEALVTDERRDYARARVTAVLEASPDRIVAPCPHRRRGCGGCAWQEVTPAAQIRLKEEIVADALRRVGHLRQLVPTSTVALPTVGYRTTVHLAVDADGRPAYRRRHDPAPLAVDSCLIAHPRITGMLGTLRLPGHRAVTIRVGAAGGERLIVLDRAPRRGAETPPDAVVVGPGDEAFVHEDVGGRRWRVSARSFFQPGPDAARALADAVDRAIGDGLGGDGLLVDAYAGVGILGGTAAGRRGCRLVAVEADGGAAADAAHNLADLAATVVTAEVGSWPAVRADVVVADPARPGLGRPGVRALVACGPRRLVLVSCDPASLGRDAALLASSGYRLVEAQIVDSFSQTTHVEVVSRFDRDGVDL